MKKIWLFIMVLLMSTSLWAEEPVDIKGWNDTTWGMTADNLRQLFGEQLANIERREIDPGKIYCNQSLKNCNINGVDFKVLFEMNTDNKLSRVRLIYNPASALHFSQFEQLLIGKYGQPKSKDDSQLMFGFSKMASWLFPSTKIELIFTHIRGLGSALNILYSDQNFVKESLDKL